MRTFSPDLIVEVTTACNRSCSGCYAPNVVTTTDPRTLIERNPEYFFSVEKIKSMVKEWAHGLLQTISLRGGEPSVHPYLGCLAEELSKIGSDIIIETHGRWLLENSRHKYSDLISKLKEIGTIIKISFDSMHGLSSKELSSIVEFLDSQDIRVLIAITEFSIEEFLNVKEQIPPHITAPIIYQKKAASIDALIKPRIGVINVNGILNQTLTSKLAPTELKINTLSMKLELVTC